MPPCISLHVPSTLNYEFQILHLISFLNQKKHQKIKKMETMPASHRAAPSPPPSCTAIGHCEVSINIRPQSSPRRLPRNQHIRWNAAILPHSPHMEHNRHGPAVQRDDSQGWVERFDAGDAAKLAGHFVEQMEGEAAVAGFWKQWSFAPITCKQRILTVWHADFKKIDYLSWIF